MVQVAVADDCDLPRNPSVSAFSEERGIIEQIITSSPGTSRYSSNWRKSVLRGNIRYLSMVEAKTYSDNKTPELNMSLANIVPKGLLKSY